MQNAKTRPMLTDTADRIIALLPEDAATTLETWIKSKSAPSGADVPADEAKPAAVDAEPRAGPDADPTREPKPAPPTATSSTR